MNDNKSISLFKVLKIALVFFVIFNFIYREIRNDREKEIYRVDVDRQIERMYEYNIKPLSGKKIDRDGGDYWGELEYGNLSKEEENQLLSNIKNDGFRELDKKYRKRVFSKDKMSIVMLVYRDSERVQIMIVNKDYDKKGR